PLGVDLVHAQARGGRAGADEGDASALQDGLQLPVLAPGAMQDGEDDVGRGREGGVERFRPDVDLVDLMAGLAQALRDRPARGERDLAFRTRAAVQNGYSHSSTQDGPSLHGEVVGRAHPTTEGRSPNLHFRLQRYLVF